MSRPFKARGANPWPAQEDVDHLHPPADAQDGLARLVKGVEQGDLRLVPVPVGGLGAPQLGKGLVATAWSEGGVPEALELPGYPLLGVQFHPERMCFGHRRQDTVDGADIFSWLIKTCQST